MPEDIHDALAICIDKGQNYQQAKPLLTQQHIQMLRVPEEGVIEDVQQSNGRVLLVEDNIINQEVALTILEELGLDVDIANNGQESLDKIKQYPDYSIVFMDCQMPVLDGYEATKEIRKIEQHKYLPIVAMTANAMVGDKEKCLECGMNDYLSKPINLNELKKIIKKWIS